VFVLRKTFPLDPTGRFKGAPKRLFS